MAYGDIRERSLLESLSPLIAAFKRYWKVAVGPALAVMIVVGVLAYSLPGYYNADARILITPQKINSKLFGEEALIEMKDRLDNLAQEILSRPRLRSIVERFRVYPEFQGVTGGEQALRKFRTNISLNPADSATGGQAAQTFRLSYTHSDPKMAFDVLNALANLFIEESLVDRRTEAQGTEEFFESQLQDARSKLEQMENKKQEFISKNFGKLPEHLEQAIARLQMLNSQIDTNSQLLSANMMRRQNLERDLNEVRSFVPAGGGEQIASDPNDRVKQLESALVMLKSRYSDEHPDVMKTKSQLAAIRAELGSGGGTRRSSGSGNIAGANPMAFSVRRQIAELDVQLVSLKNENDLLKKDIEKLQANIQEMPLKEQELLIINRDYANVKQNYERLAGAREEASLQSSLIKSQKGSQFKLVEPAEMPRIPAGPPRAIIAGGGAAAGLVVFFLIPFAMFFLNPSYRMKEDLEDDLGVKVIGVIPPMASPDSLYQTRRAGLISFIASTLSAACISALIVMVL